MFGKYDDSTSLAEESIHPIWRRDIWAVWQPEYIVWYSKKWNFGGLLFSPLIHLDRLFWHENQRDTDRYMFKNH
jgi:hypothetical protein